jgi:hypothetical protein
MHKVFGLPQYIDRRYIDPQYIDPQYIDFQYIDDTSTDDISTPNTSTNVLAKFYNIDPQYIDRSGTSTAKNCCRDPRYLVYAVFDNLSAFFAIFGDIYDSR